MSERIGWIYGLYLEGEPENIRYVGKTVSRRGVASRVYHHKYNARTTADPYPVYHWIRKHGDDAVRFRVLETTAQDRINESEIRLIREYRSRGLADLNILSGGDGVSSEEVTGEKNPKAKVTWAQVKAIREEAQKRYVPTTEISQKYGIQHAAASKILRNYSWYDPEYTPDTRISASDHAKNGDSGFAHNRIFSDRQVDEVRKDYLSGATSKTLAKRYGIGQTSISRILFRDYGSEELRQECVSHQEKMRLKKLTADQIQEINTRVFEGEAKEALAREFNVAPGTIWYHVERAKIERYEH